MGRARSRCLTRPRRRYGYPADYPWARPSCLGAEAGRYSASELPPSKRQRKSSDSQNAFWFLYCSEASSLHSCFDLDCEQSTMYCSRAQRIAFAHFAYSHVSAKLPTSPGTGGSGGTELGSPPRPQPITRQEAASAQQTTWNRIPTLPDGTAQITAAQQPSVNGKHLSTIKFRALRNVF